MMFRPPWAQSLLLPTSNDDKSRSCCSPRPHSPRFQIPLTAKDLPSTSCVVEKEKKNTQKVTSTSPLLFFLSLALVTNRVQGAVFHLKHV